MFTLFWIWFLIVRWHWWFIEWRLRVNFVLIWLFKRAVSQTSWCPENLSLCYIMIEESDRLHIKLIHPKLREAPICHDFGVIFELLLHVCNFVNIMGALNFEFKLLLFGQVDNSLLDGTWSPWVQWFSHFECGWLVSLWHPFGNWSFRRWS